MNSPGSSRGKWMALTAALLGWMFDGLEMGLFPLVAAPALRGLDSNADVGKWLGIVNAGFLIGAATGGVLFGWLGDRIGRVRAMTLSVLTYALVTGVCAFVTSPWQILVLRFVAALGMGGEWSLGVALINEIWPDRSRAFLAGLIGAAANVGYLLVGAVSKGLRALTSETYDFLVNIGLSETNVDWLMANDRWRLIMLFGATPAVLTFFIRLFVPESARWEHERSKGAASHWATVDLVGVLVGAVGGAGIIYLWAEDLGVAVRLAGTAVCFAIALGGFVYPVARYLCRAETIDTPPLHRRGPTLKRMLMGALLAGIALIGTWGSVQVAPTFAGAVAKENEEAALKSAHPEAELTTEQKELVARKSGAARETTQIVAASGAIVGTILAAFLGNWIGRRLSYCLLCGASLAAALGFYQGNHAYDMTFLASAFLVGVLTASFYGWLPLYLPELFRTPVRATGQGFAFNFGRMLAAIGALQGGNLNKYFDPTGGPRGFAEACSVISLVYILGMVVIWFAPETHGKPLPE